MIRTMAMRRRALPHCANPYAPHLLSASLRRNCNDVFFFQSHPLLFGTRAPNQVDAQYATLYYILILSAVPADGKCQ